jgi:predicted DNA-binding antitoxin AbrB/MazE fold protein
MPNQGLDSDFQGGNLMSPIKATVIYENGVLRPLETLELPEHQKARVTIEPLSDETEVAPFTSFTFPDQETPAEYLAIGYSDEGLITRQEFETYLRSFEESAGMSSAEFYKKWQNGDLLYTPEMSLWAASYEDYRENRLMFKDEWLPPSPTQSNKSWSLSAISK